MDYIIIVAGGKGVRMGAEVPKQFLLVNKKPVLMHTIQRFFDYDNALNIILVLPNEQQDYWQLLCKEHCFDVPHTVVNGGETRFESSKNGLSAIPSTTDGVVGIHDGVRPFVSFDTIKRCFDKAKEAGSAIPVVPVTDTLRYVEEAKSGKNVLRSHYRIVQTPQTFNIKLIKQAFKQPYQEQFTDDASVVEAMGHDIEMVEGNQENIKITTPLDLHLAEILCKQA